MSQNSFVPLKSKFVENISRIILKKRTVKRTHEALRGFREYVIRPNVKVHTNSKP